MHIFGLDIRRRRKQAAPNEALITHVPTAGTGGWWTLFSSSLREAYPGAWQQNVTLNRGTAMSYGAVWACVTLISQDIAKCGIKVIRLQEGVWVDSSDARLDALLAKPNHYQLRPKFIEYWLLSKLTQGNTYVLKERDAAGLVTGMYVLDPTRVQVLVSPDGQVFYQLGTDNLSGIREAVAVPAREMIHDLAVPLYHPLCGVSPLYACALAALQGMKIQGNSARFFANGSAPSGVLSAPASISKETADRLEEHWAENYAGEQNIGKVVVLGDGLKYEPLMMTAVNAQLIEQLKWTEQNICGCYHVPLYMIGLGPAPPYTDIQSLELQYYAQALQNPIENIEALLDDGIDVPDRLGIQFDLDALARMDSKTQMTYAREGVGGGILTVNEARARFQLPPVDGGDTPYLQQQMYSLEALAARDAAAAAPGTPPIAAPPAPRALLEAAGALSLEELEALVLAGLREEAA